MSKNELHAEVLEYIDEKVRDKPDEKEFRKWFRLKIKEYLEDLNK